MRFSPDSKFLIAISKEGKGQKVLAFGQVPFGKDNSARLAFPKDEALKPKPPVVAKGPGVVSDPLDKLIEDLAKLNKPGEQKTDALFLAALGRFATVTEQRRIREKYGEKMTAAAHQGILGEIAASPEFDSHLKSLQKRLSEKNAAPFRWEGGQPSILPGSGPFPGFPPLGSGPYPTLPPKLYGASNVFLVECSPSGRG